MSIKCFYNIGERLDRDLNISFVGIKHENKWSKQCFSSLLTVISMMEVPRRPQPSSFTLPLPKSSLSSLGAVENVTRTDQMFQEKKDGTTDQYGEETFSTEESSNVSVFVEPPEQSELEDTNTSTVETKLSSQDSFSDETPMSAERLAEEAEEARKKSEEEAAAAKEREAQRQLMSIEELVQSERNYLRMLQISTVTIRSNLCKLQV